MLVTIKDKDGSLNAVGQLLKSSGLSGLPDQFNVDDGLVEKGRQQAMMDHPALDNVSWQNLGILFASRQYAADHPTLQGPVAVVEGPNSSIAAAMHEALHGSPKPEFVDASDPEAAAAERSLAAAAKADADVKAMQEEIEKKKAEQQAHIDAARPKIAPAETPNVANVPPKEPQPTALPGVPAAGTLLDQTSKPGYAEALEYVKSRGYNSPGAAERVLTHVTVEQILDSKAIDEKEKAAAAAGQPSGADLDAVAAEQKAAEATASPVAGHDVTGGAESADLDKMPPASDKAQ